MKRTKLLFVILIIGTISISSCKNSFDQPTVEVTGFTLTELPQEYANLEIDLLVTNNDKREAMIKDVEYTAVIEGFTAQTENEIIGKEILVGTPLALTLPLTLKTTDAIQLLKVLNKGQGLYFEVDGTFHVDEPIKKLFDLPLDISGTANVDVGIDDFFEQPEVTVTGIDGSYSGTTSINCDLDVDNTIENMDDRDAVIDEVEYTVTIEGVKSLKHLYSTAYPATTISLPAGATIDLTLPVDLTVGIVESTGFLAGLIDGTADYVIEGTFHVTEVDGVAADFLLPLYVTGNCAADVISSK